MSEGKTRTMNSWAEALISGTAVGEREADFATRVQQNQQRVFQIAYSVLLNAADAEEVAQDAFVRAYKGAGSLRDPDKFRVWVGRIAFRLALNRRRAQARRLARDTAWCAAREDPPGHGQDKGVSGVFLGRVRTEIDRLPEKLRVVLLLSAVEGMEAREVAAVLDIPVGTVRSRLHLARKRLLGVMGT